MITIGNASDTNPLMTMTINVIGSSTIVNKNFEMPHAARIPKKNNFPKTHSMPIRNKSSNISTTYPSFV